MKTKENAVLYSKIQTDENLMENVKRSNNGFPFYYYYESISQFDFNRIDWHWHDDFEFVYVEKGYLDITIGTVQFHVNTGEALFINSKRLHYFHSNAETDLPNFLFPPELLSPSDGLINQKYVHPIVSSGLDYIVFSENSYWQKKAIEIIRQIIAINDDSKNADDIRNYTGSLNIPSKCTEMTTLSLIMQLWTLIYDRSDYASYPSADEHRVTTQGRLEIMMQFIHTNYSNHITLDEIAASANISKSSALNIFNEYLRITPVTYLIEYRLKVAARLLRSTASSIASIAVETGFESTGYFCRKFKKAYSQTPSEYRDSSF